MNGSPKMLVAATSEQFVRGFLLPYGRHFRRAGWRVDAIANGISASPEAAEAFDRVWEARWTRKPSDPRNLAAALPRVRKLVLDEGYDLVHVHTPIASFVTRLALRGLRRRKGVRVVYTAHGFHFHEGGEGLRNFVFERLERTAAPWTDALVVINRDDHRVARTFRGLARENVVYMPGIGVDLGAYDPKRVSDAAVAAVRNDLGLGFDDHLLLMVAAFDPGKRHRDAVRALAACGRDDVVLACAGTGPLEDETRELARGLGVADRVLLLGMRDDVPTLLRAADALVLPSEREGLPRSVMEALSLQRPVIGTRIRGVRDLVSEDTGVLVDVGDVHAIARGMRFLVEHPVERFQMGRRGRQAMTAFDLRRVLTMHRELYRRLLGARAGAAVGAG